MYATNVTPIQQQRAHQQSIKVGFLQHITCQLAVGFEMSDFSNSPAVGFEMSDFSNSHIINNWDAKNYIPHSLQKCKSGIHTFILTNLTEMTNKMQLFRTIYYSTVP